ncbi:DUF2178 domain-containing protein [Methanospirillum lacunae]|nr:DUF2178 domain-containing protein [Methanospirillum lacunae]
MKQIRRRDYNLILTGISVALILVLGFGIVSGNPLLITMIVVSAILAVSVAYRQIGEVMTDALSDEISGRAARTSLGLTIIITSVIFAAALTFYFSGGWGTGMGTRDDGMISIGFSQFYPPGNEIFSEKVQISDPQNITSDELFSLEQMFMKGVRVREAPLFFGVGCGSVTILLAGFFAIFSRHYGRKFED